VTPAPPGGGDRRVLHVMRMKGASGAERHLLELASALRAHGWRSDVFIPAPRDARLGSFPAELAVVCDRVRVTTVAHAWSPRLVARLAVLLRSGRYAVAHAHLVHADWLLAVASVLAPRLPLVSSKHNPDPFRRLVPFSLVERTAMRRFDYIIAISDSLAAFTRRYAGVPAVTVRYGLPTPGPPPARDPGSTAGRLLAVGRLVPQKGFDVLVDAMPEIRRRHPRAHLAIAGDGPGRDALARRIDARGLGAAVELLGQRDDIRRLMRDADVLVHPARWEGFGLVLLEAMREALPIVATGVSAIPEVVADGVSGVLVEPDDPRALAAAVVRVLDDPGHAQRLGAAGFDRLVEQFSPDRMARETAAVYERALTGLRSPAARRSSSSIAPNVRSGA
jgi:glycosyltransferase involved in cell wall biosynthesis